VTISHGSSTRRGAETVSPNPIALSGTLPFAPGARSPSRSEWVNPSGAANPGAPPDGRSWLRAGGGWARSTRPDAVPERYAEASADGGLRLWREHYKSLHFEAWRP
jgi:hypothetical protein